MKFLIKAQRNEWLQEILRGADKRIRCRKIMGK